MSARKTSGGYRSDLLKKTGEWVEAVKQSAEKEHLVKWLFVVEPAERQGSKYRWPSNTKIAATAKPVTREEFNAHIKTSVSTFFDPEVKANAISLIFSIASVGCTVREMRKEDSNIAWAKLGPRLFSLMQGTVFRE